MLLMLQYNRVHYVLCSNYIIQHSVSAQIIILYEPRQDKIKNDFFFNCIIFEIRRMDFNVYIWRHQICPVLECDIGCIIY